MQIIARELRAIWSAGLFFTRLPLPSLGSPSADEMRRSATYFPLIGWIIGGVAAGVWWSAIKAFPPLIASGLSLVSTVMLTGAMHEDGFADVCDGFGGGFTKERTLAIMQDSRVGAFGVVGLLLSLGLKWQCVAALPTALTPTILIAAHTISRSASITLMSTLDYVREGPSKARALTSKLRSWRLALVIFLGMCPVLLLPQCYLWAVIPVIIVRFIAARWFCSRLGGYTGDCLGAVQQISELVFLLAAGSLA